MDNTVDNSYTGADKCRGTASLLAANLVSGAFFKKGQTPGGYLRSELNSVVYAEIGILPGPSSGELPSESDYDIWIRGIFRTADRLISMTARPTAVKYYLMLVIDPACRAGDGRKNVDDMLTAVQQRMENAGLIAETVDIDPEAGTYKVVSGRGITHKKLLNELEKTLGCADLSGEEQVRMARNSIDETQRKFNSLRAAGPTAQKGPSLLIFLIVANVLIFVTGFVIELGSGTDPLVVWGIQDNNLIFAGEWWRLITSMFLHASWMHLISNMLFLYMLGRNIGPYYSNFQLWLIYFAGGLSGNLLGLAFSQARSLGASGAIMGLGGALLYRMTLGKNAREFRQAGNFTWIAFSVVFNLLYGLTQTGIDNYGHFGGFAGGFLVALIIGLVQKAKDKKAGQSG